MTCGEVALALLLLVSPATARDDVWRSYAKVSYFKIGKNIYSYTSKKKLRLPPPAELFKFIALSKNSTEILFNKNTLFSKKTIIFRKIQ